MTKVTQATPKDIPPGSPAGAKPVVSERNENTSREERTAEQADGEEKRRKSREGRTEKEEQRRKNRPKAQTGRARLQSLSLP
jgi:hypothetical protein